mmetsp:Transcript_56106/g.133638  ORF Transcript_56106/g.133638 Transcript_56106/m.133638 type:complete len:438 (-) Transcript_56106:351-1664(-)
MASMQVCRSRLGGSALVVAVTLGCMAWVCGFKGASFLQAPPGGARGVTAINRAAPRLEEDIRGISAASRQTAQHEEVAWDAKAAAQGLLLGAALGLCASPGEAVAAPFAASAAGATFGSNEGAGVAALQFAGVASLVSSRSEENAAGAKALGAGFAFFTALLVASIIVAGGPLAQTAATTSGAITLGLGAVSAAVFAVVSAKKLASLSTAEVGRSVQGAALAALILASSACAVPGLTEKLATLTVAQQSGLGATVLALEAAAFLTFGAHMLWTTQAGKAFGLAGCVILAVMLNPLLAASSTSLAAGALTFAGVCFAQTSSNNKRKQWEMNGMTLPTQQRQHLVASFMDFWAGKSAMSDFVPDRTTMAFWLSGFALTGILADSARGAAGDMLSAGVLTFIVMCFLATSSNNKAKEWKTKQLVVVTEKDEEAAQTSSKD